jgi:plasmid maintenance system killer protein
MNNYKNFNYTVTFNSANRKRQIINCMVDELHIMQLDMIDAAVNQSDLKQANDVINFIKEKM